MNTEPQIEQGGAARQSDSEALAVLTVRELLTALEETRQERDFARVLADDYDAAGAAVTAERDALQAERDYLAEQLRRLKLRANLAGGLLLAVMVILSVLNRVL